MIKSIDYNWHYCQEGGENFYTATVGKKHMSYGEVKSIVMVDEKTKACRIELVSGVTLTVTNVNLIEEYPDES